MVEVMGEILAGSSFERDDPRVAGLMLELIRSDDPKEQQRGLAALVEESLWEEPGPVRMSLIFRWGGRFTGSRVGSEVW